ncbi:MAG: IS4/IS5 family transposase [Actinobacteria bacterium]|nr:IS4/IS5 family transposase [Actinomycetota bacterium]
MTGSIHGMDLNDIFSQIHTDSGNLIHRISPSLRVLRLTFRHANLGISWLLSVSGKSLRIHIGVDAESGLTHTLVTTPANTADVTVADQLLHGEETLAFGDAGYRGVEKRAAAKQKRPHWHVAMRPGKRRALPDTPLGRILEKIEYYKASVRAKVEHPFHIIKNLLGLKKVRYRGLAKNTARVSTPSRPPFSTALGVKKPTADERYANL